MKVQQHRFAPRATRALSYDDAPSVWSYVITKHSKSSKLRIVVIGVIAKSIIPRLKKSNLSRLDFGTIGANYLQKHESTFEKNSALVSPGFVFLKQKNKERQPVKQLGWLSHPLVQIDAINIVCGHCGALKFKGEARVLCCLKGKVKLPVLTPPPEPFHSLLRGETPESRHFLANTQQYNGVFPNDFIWGRHYPGTWIQSNIQETQRLTFIRLYQAKLRSEECIHLHDAISTEGDAGNVGRLTILLATYTDQVDDIICAKIPEPLADPELYDAVSTNMIHGPCGAIDPQSPCIVNGKCLKRYPRQLTAETITGNDGNPLNRRRSPDDNVHLENGQRVYFATSNAAQRVETPPATTLTSFFEICQSDPFTRTFLYSEMPCYYTWNDSTKKFQRRKQDDAVLGHPGVRSTDALGRIYSVHPKNDECFYLLLLLVNVRGPTSFESLRTVNGVVYPTFRAACQELNLLENDNH
ncbi:hypothetical protein EVAR_38071_1 [Eumeta japonica]|uniref:Helitron helicase-like domain-containing protein n=1 Tax=Eumeta variegata TaxID=151549 RepID=A0A4C1W7G6_EUMVA|nr:hypothetical protein EVAR_38071_1 [Eumeta japonica]